MQQPHHLEKIEEDLSKIGSAGIKLRDSTFARFPILFSLLTTFGLVATFYGFEKVIDKFTLFTDYPEILLIVGLAILAGTGTLYKKLS